MTLYKNVNGIRVEMSPEEETKTRGEWEANKAAQEAKAWLEGRKRDYPQIVDQLDMLWHELQANGHISADGEWYKAIEAVKNKYPKPE